jgi:hypothetical protein
VLGRVGSLGRLFNFDFVGAMPSLLSLSLKAPDVAMRYDKLAANYLAFIQLASIRL